MPRLYVQAGSVVDAHTLLGDSALNKLCASVELIDRKRRGECLSAAEIGFLVSGFTRGDIPDYQMSAWLMAVCCRGMSAEELLALTEAMAASGEQLDLSDIRPVADKHSTGGVGDKTTLVWRCRWCRAGLRWPRCPGEGSASPAALSTSSNRSPASEWASAPGVRGPA